MTVPARDTARSWGWVSRGLHWVMAGLILFQLGLGVRMVHFTPDLIVRFDLTQLHKSWGTVILALAALRLAWRSGNASPSPPPGMPRWQVRAARVSHAMLYLLMFVLPLSGWVMAAASPTQDLLGIENMAFGVVVLPDPWQPGDAAIEDAARGVHIAAALLLTAILAVHVTAALHHHFRNGDDVLRRMTVGR